MHVLREMLSVDHKNADCGAIKKRHPLLTLILKTPGPPSGQGLQPRWGSHVTRGVPLARIILLLKLSVYDKYYQYVISISENFTLEYLPGVV